MSELRQDIEENSLADLEEYGPLSPEIQEKLAWFQDQKVGVIFHWGLYAVAGIVESWQLSEEDSWARKRPWRDDLDQLRHDYWQLNQQFNPTKFDPQDWAEKSQAAGFRYMIFTTKHHDGFNMYDTAFSDYKVTGVDTPFHSNPHGDIFSEVSQAFRKEGLGVGAYYSKPDWHCEYYWVPKERPVGRYASYDPLEFPERWEKYNQFVENQLIELTHNYGKIDILWLDGGWVNSQNNEFLRMDEIVPKLRAEEPDLLIVDRTIGGDYENYVTPERKIPQIPPKKAWESNIPLAKNWGYVPNDQYKSFDEILHSLVQIVALGGNVIYGVGPKPDGTLPKEAEALMAELGGWLKTYGEGIYASRPHQVVTEAGWYFTQGKTGIYGFADQDAKRHLDLQEAQIVCQKAEMVGSNEAVAISQGRITIPENQEIMTVIKFT